MRRIRSVPLLVAALVVLAGASRAAENHRVEILWDTYGVPHIFSKDVEGLFRAFGYAQMQSHGDLILRLYGEARGRGAEYWGEKYLDGDRWVRINGIPARAGEWYRAQRPEFRRCLDAFAAGVNAYAADHGDRIARDVKVVLPVTAVDLLAHAQLVIDFSFVVNQQVVAAATGPAGARAAAAGSPFADWAPAAGSNTWAIGPSRSASHKAMLLANPHLPWSGYLMFYEAQLVGPGIDAYGATLVGFPAFGIAFNDHLGWSHTVNTIDAADLFELTPAKGGYRFDGKVRAFATETEHLKVKQSDGALRDVTLVVRRSVQGPVVGEKNGKPIALRVAGIDQPGMLEEWWDMARATNLREFEAALKRLQIPMFTVMYADRDGHILHVFNGRVPVRPKGDYNWSGIVPGDTSATLWTGTHPYEDLPRVLDPPTGWLQNTNDPPWTTTFPMVLDPDKFPPYMAPRHMSFRTQRSVRMLAEDSSITFDEMVRYKHSTRMELADRILEELIAAARRQGGETAHQAAGVLAKWDRSADAGSRGAVLFQAFANRWWHAGQNYPFAIPWSLSAARTTPRGLADPAQAVAALEAAAKELQARYGRLDVAWGDVYRLRRGNLDLPGNGGSGDLGIFRVVNYSPESHTAIGGDSYVAVVEFSNPVRARVLIGYGNASQPGSPHQTDQLPFFARKQLRPAWRTRQEVEAHLESRQVF